jgi:hypothetical protein
MRAVMLALATVVAVPMFGIDRLVPSPLQAAGQVAEIVAKAREALGGEQRLSGVSALTAEGPFRRTMGAREMEGTITLTLGVPGKIRHEEDLELPGGGGMTRLSGMNGDHAWEDTANRGGMGGGQIMIRRAGPGGGDQEPDPEMLRAMQQRRLTAMYERLSLALLASADELTHAGIAEVGNGTADVLETKDAAGRPVRLFISQETHLPIAISYMEVRPRMMIEGGPRGPGGPGGPGARGGRGQGGPPPPDAAEMRQRMQAEGPPPPSTVIMRLEDHRIVNGLRLPHLLVQTVDGQPTEEWTITKYQVNPRLKADLFDRK